MQANILAYRLWGRWSWHWLAVGAVLLPFAHIQTVWPLAAWLSPAFLVRFGRTQRVAVGMPLIVLAECAGAAVGMRNDFTTLPLYDRRFNVCTRNRHCG